MEESCEMIDWFSNILFNTKASKAWDPKLFYYRHLSGGSFAGRAGAGSGESLGFPDAADLYSDSVLLHLSFEYRGQRNAGVPLS